MLGCPSEHGVSLCHLCLLPCMLQGLREACLGFLEKAHSEGMQHNAMHHSPAVNCWSGMNSVISWLAKLQESGGLGRRALIAALLVGGSTAWWKYLDGESLHPCFSAHVNHALYSRLCMLSS